MSYTVELIVGPLSDNDKVASKEIEALRESYYDDKREKAASLVQLHSVLTARYPCLSSFANGDSAIDGCPWADGPMINNFGHETMNGTTSSTLEKEIASIPNRNKSQPGKSIARMTKTARRCSSRRARRKKHWRGAARFRGSSFDGSTARAGSTGMTPTTPTGSRAHRKPGWGPQDLACIQIVSVGEHPPLDGKRIARKSSTSR
jgi:hypothetical protein